MYTVGLDEEGNTVLKIGTDFTTTLTMNESSVIQMIRLLAATLNTVTVDIDWNDNEPVS